MTEPTPSQTKCTPYADARPCKLRNVLDGEQWCSTHEAYRWRPGEWREWNRAHPNEEKKTND